MKLDKRDRLVLSNLLRILQRVEGEDYSSDIKALEDGYSFYYPGDHIEDEMPEHEAETVHQILEMHRALYNSYQALPGDKGGIAPEDVRFQGFDGNHETRLYAFTRFLLEDKGLWAELAASCDDLNSHMRKLERYQEMVERWKASADPHQLTADDIKRILGQ